MQPNRRKQESEQFESELEEAFGQMMDISDLGRQKHVKQDIDFEIEEINRAFDEALVPVSQDRSEKVVQIEGLKVGDRISIDDLGSYDEVDRSLVQAQFSDLETMYEVYDYLLNIYDPVVTFSKDYLNTFLQVEQMGPLSEITEKDEEDGLIKLSKDSIFTATIGVSPFKQKNKDVCYAIVLDDSPFEPFLVPYPTNDNPNKKIFKGLLVPRGDQNYIDLNKLIILDEEGTVVHVPEGGKYYDENTNVKTSANVDVEAVELVGESKEVTRGPIAREEAQVQFEKSMKQPSVKFKEMMKERDEEMKERDEEVKKTEDKEVKKRESLDETDIAQAKRAPIILYLDSYIHRNPKAKAEDFIDHLNKYVRSFNKARAEEGGEIEQIEVGTVEEAMSHTDLVLKFKKPGFGSYKIGVHVGGNRKIYLFPMKGRGWNRRGYKDFFRKLNIKMGPRKAHW